MTGLRATTVNMIRTLLYVLSSLGLNIVNLYKYIIARLQALKYIVTNCIQKGFRRKSIDFCELHLVVVRTGRTK